jgi:hypothetical protein
MDMYWAHVLNTNLKKFKKDSKEKKVMEKEEHMNEVNESCGVCGQNPYFCMCKENSKLIRKTGITAYT